jgi:hypothetical protein
VVSYSVPALIPEEQRRRFEETCAGIVEEWRPWFVGWLALRARLEREGFRIIVDPDDAEPTIAPIQLAGVLPSGESFYFRGRHQTCSLRIALSGDDPIGNAINHPVWREAVSRWDDHEAGWLEAEEAEAVIRELLAMYLAQKEDGPPSA